MHSSLFRACVAGLLAFLAFATTAQAKDKVTVTNNCSQTANMLFRHIPEKDKPQLNGWWEIATNQTLEIPIIHIATEDLYFYGMTKNTHWDGLMNVIFDDQYWGMMKSSSTPDEKGDRHLTLECPDIKEPGYTEAEHAIYVQNDCNDTINLLLRYQPEKNKWVTNGWWSVPPQGGIFPRDNNKKEIVQLPGSNIYVYGITEKTGITTWNGPEDKTKFQGKTYPLMKLQPYSYNKADSLIILNCPK